MYLLYVYTNVLIKILLHWEEKNPLVLIGLVKPKTVLTFFSSSLLGKL